MMGGGELVYVLRKNSRRLGYRRQRLFLFLWLINHAEYVNKECNDRD